MIRTALTAVAISGALTAIAFTPVLDPREEKPSLTVATALHPGVVRTGFGRGPEGSMAMSLLMRLAGPFLRSPERGARTSVLLATMSVEELGDRWYWSEGEPATPLPIARDARAAAELWNLTARITGLADHNDGGGQPAASSGT